MKKIFISISIFFAISSLAQTQDTVSISSMMGNNNSDTSQVRMTNMDAIYTRPFVYSGNLGKSTTSIGGYLEGNTNYFVQDGITDGFSMEMRRFNIFLYSVISPHIRFLSELEFEHGTQEIAIETAIIDVEFDPLLVVRSGIILPPVGYFNQNHDGPKWEFIERPMVSTMIIPATLSEIGFGVNGKYIKSDFTYTYEFYLVNGLGNEVISNDMGRVSLQAGKHDEIFAEDNNGTPSVTGRIATKHRSIGEVGFSYYGGIYNTFRADGLDLDSKRRLDLLALDANLSYGNFGVIGEAAWVKVDVPDNLGPGFSEHLGGFHTDILYTIRKGSFRHWENTVLKAVFRTEMVDFAIGEFAETGKDKRSEIVALVPGLSFRFSQNTVFKANYRYEWHYDLLGNPPVKRAGYQFGFASYF